VASYGSVLLRVYFFTGDDWDSDSISTILSYAMAVQVSALIEDGVD
jgi:hypothetical protein